MKKLLLLLLMLTVIEAKSYSQIVSSSCSAPDSILELYRDDANRLALERIYVVGDPDTVNITIPLSYIDSIMEALIAVYNANTLSARDTVVDLLTIHTFPIPSNSIFVEVYDTNAWTGNFMNNAYPTGHSVLDSLVDKYDLTVVDVSIGFLPTTFFLTVEFPEIMNVYALMDSLQLVSGVNSTSENMIFGDGADIVYSELLTGNGTIRKLTYSYGWGDCLAGCIYNRYWEFYVYPDCSVEYLGSYGDLLDSTIMGIKPIHSFGMKLFPNPFSNEIRVQLDDLIENEVDLRLFDITGHILFEDKRKVEGHNYQYTYDFSKLESGLFYLEISNGEMSRKQLIIKQ